MSDIVFTNYDVSITWCCVDGISVGGRIVQVDDICSYHATARNGGHIGGSEHRSETSTHITTERNQISVTALNSVNVQVCLRRVFVCPSTVADIANVVIVVERFSSSM